MYERGAGPPICRWNMTWNTIAGADDRHFSRRPFLGNQLHINRQQPISHASDRLLPAAVTSPVIGTTTKRSGENFAGNRGYPGVYRTVFTMWKLVSVWSRDQQTHQNR